MQITTTQSCYSGSGMIEGCVRQDNYEKPLNFNPVSKTPSVMEIGPKATNFLRDCRTRGPSDPRSTLSSFSPEEQLPYGLTRSRQNHTQKPWFHDLLALTPEVENINFRGPDLMTFWPWHQKPRKSIPEAPIRWLSGLGPRSRENQTQKFWFNDSSGPSPRNPRSPDLMTFWPWTQKARKSLPEVRKSNAPVPAKGQSLESQSLCNF